MSAPSEPVPTLELPSDRLMQWSQMAMLLATRLAARREQLDRLAFSDAEHTARVHDRAERVAALASEPAVRAMTAAEIAHWPTGSDDATGPRTLPVTAEVAPAGDRWALHATTRGGDTVSHTWVSCRDENIARSLAGEIVAVGEPAAVDRLGGHIQLGEQLAIQHAQRKASAPRVDRDAMATQLRGAWPTQVTAAVLRCPAWPTLADTLADAAGQGHDLDRVLSGIDTRGIPTARKPAALAAWLLARATSSGAADGEPRHPDHDRIMSWAQQLDPNSMIDRVGAAGVVGYCDTKIDTRLITRYPDLLDDAAHDEATTVAAEGLAGDRERSAAAQAASVDDPSTPQREDLDAAALAGRDLHEAAAARATAAERHGAANAAVARANVTLTAPGATPTAPATSHQVTAPPHPQQPAIQPNRSPRRGR
jgi:hypothetical protein